jgi:small subunit ribosomal protein S8e
MSKKTNIMSVVYNASSNELVRTNTLVKNAIIYIDATPFKSWYLTHYGVSLGKKGQPVDAETGEVKVEIETTNRSARTVKRLRKRGADRFIDPNLQG